MGDEFGQTNEWNHKSELQWELLQYDAHRLLKDCVARLNYLMKDEPALYEKQFKPGGFEWVDLNHRSESVIVYKRIGNKRSDDLLIILNMTPVVRNDWEIETTGKEFTKEIFNSDSKEFWGTGNVYNPDIRTELIDKNQKTWKLKVNLPALAGIVLK